LNIIITSPPAEIPLMELESAAPLHFQPFIFGHTYDFEFTIKEMGGISPLQNIDIFASNLVDQFGNVIPAANFTFVPNTIAEIPAGGSQTVQGTLVTPASFGKSDPGLFQGIITAQTTQQSKGIAFKLGNDDPPPPVPLSNWSILLSIFLIVSLLAIFFRFKGMG
jgi:hypothetical protein